MVACMAFFGFCVIYMLRVNLSVAIVAMTQNRTHTAEDGTIAVVRLLLYSDAASGWARWALAHPEFGSSVNPITTRGADYAHHITSRTPGFENPAASLV